MTKTIFFSFEGRNGIIHSYGNGVHFVQWGGMGFHAEAARGALAGLIAGLLSAHGSK